MATTLPYLSASRIKTYLQCPQKYKLQYVDKIPWEFTPISLILGTTIHTVVECYYREYQNDRFMDAATMCTLFDEFWKNEIEGKTLDTDEPDSVRLQGHELLKVFASEVQPQFVLSVEDSFEVDIIDKETGEILPVPLRGRIDLIEEDIHGNAVVVDLKTAARRPSDSEMHNNIQLWAYGYVERNCNVPTNDRDVLVRIDALVKTKTPAFDQRFTLVTRETDKKFVRMCKDIIHAIQAEAFPANPGWGCEGCPVKEHCYIPR
ncbi:PD-(D/E)XK nuclease family protein [bacterium]|nr:PD-(D/E)XK nuclease family protein [bacterium]